MWGRSLKSYLIEFFNSVGVYSERGAINGVKYKSVSIVLELDCTSGKQISRLILLQVDL